MRRWPTTARCWPSRFPMLSRWRGSRRRSRTSTPPPSVCRGPLLRWSPRRLSGAGPHQLSHQWQRRGTGLAHPRRRDGPRSGRRHPLRHPAGIHPCRGGLLQRLHGPRRQHEGLPRRGGASGRGQGLHGGGWGHSQLPLQCIACSATWLCTLSVSGPLGAAPVRSPGRAIAVRRSPLGASRRARAAARGLRLAAGRRADPPTRRPLTPGRASRDWGLHLGSAASAVRSPRPHGLGLASARCAVPRRGSSTAGDPHRESSVSGRLDTSTVRSLWRFAPRSLLPRFARLASRSLPRLARAPGIAARAPW